MKPFRKRETVKPESPVVMKSRSPGDECAKCDFGVPSIQILGIMCRRFPEFHAKNPKDWCGEFKPKEP